MGPKKGGKKGAKQDDDDDWEALLNQEIEANKVINAKKAEEDKAAQAAADAATALTQEDLDDDEEEGGGPVKKDKKKKPKKGKGGAKAEAEPSKAPLSAAARVIQERQLAREEEEARVKAHAEAEAARIKAEEEKEEAEAKIAEEERERKRKQKEDKVAAQKAAGTYMTKAEKEKQKKVQARLDAMKASGVAIPPRGDSTTTAKASSATNNNNKKKQPPAKNVHTAPLTVTPEEVKVEVEVKEEKVEVQDTVTEAPAPIVLVDNWDDSDGDDWEGNFNIIGEKLGALKTQAEEDVEDTLELEAKLNQEKLKKLGQERAKRETEERLKREQEESEREELEAKEREAAMKKETSRRNRLQRDKDAMALRSPDNLRSPISCIMGHVDTGKTKLLDKIRHTSVQEGEAGGITQQIGATQFSKETLQIQTQCMQATQPFTISIPGLLMIDTPGHESFSNLRSRGSSLCDIAILVIDLMHGLEPQTIESINLLKRKRTPFIVALNKIDRCYGWKSVPDTPIQEALANQDENCRREFKDRTDQIIVQLMELSLNACLYWDNDDLAGTLCLVPTSAVTGEGVPDLLKTLICLSQTRQCEQLQYMEVVQCTVLEVKAIEGLGHTVDVVLVNGTLREGDTIVVSTMDGPVVTNIRALLTPPPNREMRVKSEYVHHQQLSGAVGIKIVAPDIGRALAGTPVMVVRYSEGDELSDVMEDVQSDLTKLMKGLQTDSKGVMVHASTLGALEALLQYLREECKPPIPVSFINIGPIRKKDVTRASIMHEKKLPEYATILAFDVPMDAEARNLAEECNVQVFSAEIIYHLFDQFNAYMQRLNEKKKEEASAVVVFPCVLKILPQCVFNKKDPIVIGVEVLEGTLRLNTPLCLPGVGLDIGRVTKIESNHKEVTVGKKGTQVSIRIVNESNPTLTYGRQFDDKINLYSKMNRGAIDALKDYFKDEMTKDDWTLTIKLKKVFNIS